jgi:hypothetical protein
LRQSHEDGSNNGNKKSNVAIIINKENGIFSPPAAYAVRILAWPLSFGVVFFRQHCCRSFTS